MSPNDASGLFRQNAPHTDIKGIFLVNVPHIYLISCFQILVLLEFLEDSGTRLFLHESDEKGCS
jgi:hypothetical protein